MESNLGDDFLRIPTPPPPGFRKLYLTAICALMGSVSMGTVLGYSSPALESINKPNSEFDHLTQEEQSWVGSIVAIGALFGGLATGPFIDRFGRRTTMVIITAPFTAGWLIIAYSHSLIPMLAGRVITGFCCGSVSLVVPIYVSEIATQEIRGFLGSCVQLFIVSGVLLIYLLGVFINFSWLAIISASFPFFMSLSMACMPESPIWLLHKNRRNEAVEAIRYLNGAHHDPEYLCHKMEQHMARQTQGAVTFSELCSASSMKPLTIAVLLMVFQQWCGINGIMFYASSVFQSSGYNKLSPATCSNILAAVLVAATIVGTLIMEKVGRKVLLLASSFFMAIALIVQAVILEMGSQRGSWFLAKYGWLTVLSLSVYIAAFSIGYGPIPWLMMGEILPQRVKGVASSIITAFNWSNVFLLTKEFHIMLGTLKDYGTYFFFAAVCVLSCFFVIFAVPETRGLSNEDIDKLFNSCDDSDEEERLIRDSNITSIN